MMRISKKTFSNVFIIVVIISVTTLLASSVYAFSLDLMGLGWNKPMVKIAIKPAKGITPQAVADVEAAVNDWIVALSSVQGAPTVVLDKNVRKADITIHMKVGGGSTLGYALPKTVSPFSCVLYSVSIQLSGKYLGDRFSSAGTRNVARHELGHAFGLGHSSDPGDLMFWAADSEEIFGNTDIDISSCDMKGIREIYPLPQYCEILDSISCR